MHAIFVARHLETENKLDTHISIMILRCLFYLMTLSRYKTTEQRNVSTEKELEQNKPPQEP
jgi:hypothetical protein